MGIWYKNTFYEANRIAFRLALRAYFRIEVIGARQIPRTGALIVASNHASALDPVLIGTYVPRQVTFLAKEELFRPPLSWYLRFMGTESIRRGRADVGALRAALRALEREEVVILFPEGTRTRTGGLAPGKPGLGKIVVASGATVVPAWVGGSFCALPAGARLPRPMKIRVAFGAPIPPSHWGDVPDAREGYAEISRRVMREIFTLSEQYAITSTQPFLEESRRNLSLGSAGADASGGSAKTSSSYR
ncbi:1-acyl-sn-glycerol-3-phosphate acyltransferase [bacterium]|nr:1-acyl-sn-glycerol-3-phosphate acyltransferase [bacterium]